MSHSVPQIGDRIYVPRTDVVHQSYIEGGAAHVSDVWTDNGRTYVSVREDQDTSFAWEYLAEQQDRLQKKYGDSPAGRYMLGPNNPSSLQ